MKREDLFFEDQYLNEEYFVNFWGIIFRNDSMVARLQEYFFLGCTIKYFENSCLKLIILLAGNVAFEKQYLLFCIADACFCYYKCFFMKFFWHTQCNVEIPKLDSGESQKNFHGL